MKHTKHAHIAKSIRHLDNADQLQTRANAIARKAGHQIAHSIVLGDIDRVVNHVKYGYRKKTTGQYVPNSYVQKGWSSVYYENAWTTVELAH